MHKMQESKHSPITESQEKSAFLVIIVVGTIIAILMGFGRAIPYLT